MRDVVVVEALQELKRHEKALGLDQVQLVLVEFGILDCNRNLRREQLDDLDAVFGEDSCSEAVLHVNGALEFALAHQGNAEHRLGLACQEICIFSEGAWLGRIVKNDRGVRVQHMVDDRNRQQQRTVGAVES